METSIFSTLLRICRKDKHDSIYIPRRLINGVGRFFNRLRPRPKPEFCESALSQIVKLSDIEYVNYVSYCNLEDKIEWYLVRVMIKAINRNEPQNLLVLFIPGTDDGYDIFIDLMVLLRKLPSSSARLIRLASNYLQRLFGNQSVITIEGTAEPDYLSNSLQRLLPQLDYWMDDELIYPQQLNLAPDNRVHSGFYRAYTSMIPPLEESVHNQNDKEIYVVGHSLGAAVGLLTGVHLNQFTDKKVHLITFGSPRVGNEAFVTSCNKFIDSNNRFVNGSDIVTDLPPEIAGYRHPNIPPRPIGKARLASELKDHYLNNYDSVLCKDKFPL